MTCPHCNTTDESDLIPVWEDKQRQESGKQPKFVGCTNCHRMHRPKLLRGDSRKDTFPQAELTDHEISRLQIGNQHSDDLSIIEWRVVKGAAVHYGVSDWTAIADSTLSAQENVSLMERACHYHTDRGGATP